MLLYAGTIFLSAFLLFLVQPVIAKQILPWFGGAAAVWAMGVGDEVTWRLYVAPGSITRVGCRPHGPVLLSFNETR